MRIGSEAFATLVILGIVLTRQTTLCQVRLDLQGVVSAVVIECTVVGTCLQYYILVRSGRPTVKAQYRRNGGESSPTANQTCRLMATRPILSMLVHE